MKKILLNARPHPGPHPRGEGESYPVSVEYLQLDLQDTREEIQNARFLFPLLGGEGQGKGGLQTIFAFEPEPNLTT